MAVEAAELVAWLDEYLRTDEIEDYPGALNGLQVEPGGPILRLGAATDACQATIDLAVAGDCQLLLVHHGLFWGDPVPLVGPAFRRVRTLIRAGTGVYSSHLPLDAHDEVGNNVLLARALDLPVVERFGRYGASDGLGVIVRADLGRQELERRVAGVCGTEPHVIPGGTGRISRLAILTGGGGSMMDQAHLAGADALLTGEGAHHTYHEAMERGIDVLYAGHYATETFGVRALAERAARQFGLEHRFFDVPTGL